MLTQPTPTIESQYPIKDITQAISALSGLPGFAALCSTPHEDSRWGIYTALPSHCWHNLRDSTLAHQALASAEAELEKLSTQAQASSPHNMHSHAAIHEVPFIAGLLGYLGYELGANLLPFATAPTHPDNLLLHIGLFHWSLVTDRKKKASWLQFHPACPTHIREAVLNALQPASAPTDIKHDTPFRLIRPFSPKTHKVAYLEAIEQIHDFIRSGDCYQVNLSQKWTGNYQGDALQAFWHLLQHMPVPYAAWLDCGDHQILSLSPEQFLGITHGRIESRPIKGTRPRGHSLAEDQSQIQALITSEKDRAENLMIVDLIRNDLSRVCQLGSIQAEELFAIKTYPNVHHLVSTITGQLRHGISPLQALLSAFPGGSITGAPKMRAMEIIHQLEPHSRGPYCGSIFYCTPEGRLDSSIAIRTLMAEPNKGEIHCWGGGGVVMDSDAEAEYAESITKVKTLMTLLSNFNQ